MGVRYVLDLSLSVEPPFLLFFPAILAAALWFGPGPALCCTGLSTLAVAWHWMPPASSLAVRDAGDVEALLLFAASGVLMSLLVEAGRRGRSRRLVVEQASDGIFIADLEGKYLDVNAAGCRMLGYARERGTRFRLIFPGCEAPAEREAAAAAPAALRPQGRTVLLVEDDRLVRASLRRFLEGKGYRVLVAGSPSEALTAARDRGSIDVLVTDMVMPESSGRELASELGASLPGLKVIFMSANPAEILIEQGRLQPGAPYLEKPFEMEALERLLVEALSP